MLDFNTADSKISVIMEEILLLRLQTFQRIQRNRQSRIRVKLSRRAGKRSDEILEEDVVEPVSNSHQHDLHHQFQQRTKMEQPQSSSTPGKTKILLKIEKDCNKTNYVPNQSNCARF